MTNRVPWKHYVKTLGAGATRAEEEESEIDFLVAEDHVMIDRTPRGYNYSVDLSDTISPELKNYKDLFKVFRKATDSDVIIMRLTNLGGACHTGYRILQEMQDSDAYIVVYVINEVHSMASVLALAGNELHLAPGAMMMFHNYSGIHMGKGGEVASAIEHERKHYYKLDELHCYPFLTKKELQKIRDDNDVYIHQTDKDLTTRIAKHFKKRK